MTVHQILFIVDLQSTNRGVPSNFATIEPAESQGLRRCLMLPYFSIWFTLLSVVSCARGFALYGIISTGRVPDSRTNVLRLGCIYLALVVTEEYRFCILWISPVLVRYRQV